MDSMEWMANLALLVNPVDLDDPEHVDQKVTLDLKVMPDAQVYQALMDSLVWMEFLETLVLVDPRVK